MQSEWDSIDGERDRVEKRIVLATDETRMKHGSNTDKGSKFPVALQSLTSFSMGSLVFVGPRSNGSAAHQEEERSLAVFVGLMIFHMMRYGNRWAWCQGLTRLQQRLRRFVSRVNSRLWIDAADQNQ